MNIIEHAILIPASPDTVWEYISDISNNSAWQPDCQNISFISTDRVGNGTRWRYQRGKKSVITEITAWYDKLGYEYTDVEGSPFSENKGRIRLQEVAEGTIVQWTFTYQTTGMLGGLRNSLSTKSSVKNDIANGLRALYREVQSIERSKTSQLPFEAKTLMRDAPSAEERSSYKPRHTSVLDKKALEDTSEEIPATAGVSAPSEFEPPIADDDTQPTSTFQRVDVSGTTSDARDDQGQSRDSAPQDQELPAPEYEQPPVVEARDVTPSEVVEPVDLERTVIESSYVDDIAITADDIKDETDVDEPALDEDYLSTAEISVFEVFGLQKPSESQLEMQRVIIDEHGKVAPQEEADVEDIVSELETSLDEATDESELERTPDDAILDAEEAIIAESVLETALDDDTSVDDELETESPIIDDEPISPETTLEADGEDVKDNLELDLVELDVEDVLQSLDIDDELTDEPLFDQPDATEIELDDLREREPVVLLADTATIEAITGDFGKNNRELGGAPIRNIEVVDMGEAKLYGLRKKERSRLTRVRSRAK